MIVKTQGEITTERKVGIGDVVAVAGERGHTDDMIVPIESYACHHHHCCDHSESGWTGWPEPELRVHHHQSRKSVFLMLTHIIDTTHETRDWSCKSCNHRGFGIFCQQQQENVSSSSSFLKTHRIVRHFVKNNKKCFLLPFWTHFSLFFPSGTPTTKRRGGGVHPISSSLSVQQKRLEFHKTTMITGAHGEF